MLLYQDYRIIEDTSVQQVFGSTAAFWLQIAQMMITIGVWTLSLLIPRRPHVFRAGFPIDKQLTVSALGRYSFSWAIDVINLANKKRRLDLKDLPRLNHDALAKTLSEKWASRPHVRKLWIELLLAHKGAIALQWFLTLIMAFGQNFGTQFVIYRILLILEARPLGESTSLEAWMWVVVLCLFTLSSSSIEAWLFWINWSEVGIPIRTELSALIFEKGMRRKDIKGASRTAKKTSTGDTSSVVPDVEEEEEEGDPKGKQSTVNLIGIDAKRIGDFASVNNLFISSISKLALSLTFLVVLIGWKSLLAGMIAASLVYPVNIYYTRKYASAQDRVMKVRDEKMGVVTEALQGKFSPSSGAEGNR